MFDEANDFHLIIDNDPKKAIYLYILWYESFLSLCLSTIRCEVNWKKKTI